VTPQAYAARRGCGKKMRPGPEAVIVLQASRGRSTLPAFCRDCFTDAADGKKRCAKCGSRRILSHSELNELSIAHLDCDAFYAAIEKRDDPSLADQPVIVGGGKRGVVSTCCYIARIDGVRSAMPMFQALELCPNAVVIKPRMAKYVEEGRRVRSLMHELTPLVEPLSLDEAYLDLSGTEKLHHVSPAKSMAKLAKRIETEIGITVSTGLSHNKFLAKLASEIDKPRGFAVIGRTESVAWLRDKPVGYIRGAGAALQARLAKDGIMRISQLQDTDARILERRYGNTGAWLHRMAFARDDRKVDPSGEMKSVSSETTFENDICDRAELEKILWRQAERVSARAKDYGIGGRTVTLKLKTSAFKLITRSISLEAPTQLADRMFRVSRELLRREADGTAYRLLGVGIHQLLPAQQCDPDDLVDDGAGKRAKAEHAMDKVRAKFGGEAVGKGRTFGAKKHDVLSPNRKGVQ
jgi:DNA polymerase-4